MSPGCYLYRCPQHSKVGVFKIILLPQNGIIKFYIEISGFDQKELNFYWWQWKLSFTAYSGGIPDCDIEWQLTECIMLPHDH